MSCTDIVGLHFLMLSLEGQNISFSSIWLFTFKMNYENNIYK